MANLGAEFEQVPMSVRMRRVLSAIEGMSVADRIQLLVKAGLMTEAEAHEAIKQTRQTSKLHRPHPSKKSTKARVR